MDFDFTLEAITPNSGTVLSVSSTGAIALPSGNTAQRPATPSAGLIRWNTSLSTPTAEYYSGSTWIPITLATNLLGGSAGSIPYQSSASTTAMLSVGSNGQFLSIASGLPTWSTIGTASYSVNIGPSGTVAWVVDTGGYYTATVTHNLGTQNVVVSLADISNNQLVQPDLITITSSAVITVRVFGNTKTLRVTVIANGASIAAGASTPSSIIVQNSGTPLSGTYTAINLTGILSATGAAGTATISSAPFTGDATSSGTALTLATVNSNIGTFVVSTVNGKGLVTSAANMSGDVTTSGAVATLATVNATVGTFGSASAIPVVTVNAKGLVTNVTTVAVATSTIIRTLSYYATSLDSPNNADWTINALAATTADPTNGAVNTRQFSNTVEQGVGFTTTVPNGATNIIFTYRGRSASATAGTLQMRVYNRVIASATPAAIGAWSAATNLTSVSSPANVFYQTFTQTLTISSLSLTAGNMYQFEITRNVGVAGNLAFNWLMSELTISFT